MIERCDDIIRLSFFIVSYVLPYRMQLVERTTYHLLHYQRPVPGIKKNSRELRGEYEEKKEKTDEPSIANDRLVLPGRRTKENFLRTTYERE